jgi:hypothetical protein
MIEKIFISHCARLTDRKQYLDGLIANHPFFQGRTIINSADEAMDDKYVARSTFVAGRYPAHMKRQDICATEQMFDIYQQVLDSGCKTALVLEDDIILPPYFDQEQERVFAAIPADAHATYIGGCGNMLVPADYPHEFWPTNQSRCGIAHTVTRECCEKILADRTYYFPIDWHLFDISQPRGLKYYWSKTILFLQGSQDNGSNIYKSTKY